MIYCFQVAKGLTPPYLTACSYLPLSVPSMWEILFNLEDITADTSSAFGMYMLITFVTYQLEQGAMTNWCRQDIDPGLASLKDESGYSNVVDNLCSIQEELGSRHLALGMLRNLPNVTFHEVFDTLSPRSEDTIKYCSNGENSCRNIETLFPAQFPKCFGYNTLENNSSNSLSDEGISNGVTMVLMTGNQLASAFKKAGKILDNLVVSGIVIA